MAQPVENKTINDALELLKTHGFLDWQTADKRYIVFEDEKQSKGNQIFRKKVA